MSDTDTTVAELQNSDQQEVDGPNREGKYLTFALGSEEYGLEILKVREIFGIMEITAIPRTPQHVKGVINLRGQVIPVIDIRIKFDMESVQTTDQTCVIVVETEQNNQKFSTGLVVDRVQEVLEIKEDAIQDSPNFGSKVDTNFILGMGKVGKAVKILLDIDKVLDGDDLDSYVEEK
jgi:purine-binding chemotaxis protein CheW